jgi:hypothetical protein
MTHDELLAKIKANGTYYDGNTGITTEVATRPHRNDKALRAVVELHKPEPIPIPCPDGKSGCAALHYANRHRCTCGAYKYPCPTIQAIEKELR